MEATKGQAFSRATVSTATDSLLLLEELLQGVLSHGNPVPLKSGFMNDGGIGREKTPLNLLYSVADTLIMQQQLSGTEPEKSDTEYELLKSRVLHLEQAVDAMAIPGSTSDSAAFYRNHLVHLRLRFMKVVATAHRESYQQLLADRDKVNPVLRPSSVNVVMGFVKSCNMAVLKSPVFQDEVLPYITGALAGLPLTLGALCDRTWRCNKQDRAEQLEHVFDVILQIKQGLLHRSERKELALSSGLFRLAVCTGSVRMAVKLRHLLEDDPSWHCVPSVHAFMTKALAEISSGITTPKRSVFPPSTPPSSSDMQTICLLSALTQHKDFFRLDAVQSAEEGSPPELPAHKQWTHCAAFDGTFAYLLSPRGVLKLGTGYGFTVPGHVYAYTVLEKELDQSFSCSVVCVAGSLLITQPHSPSELIRISCDDLKVNDPLVLSGEKVPLLASERQFVHVLHVRAGSVVLDIVDPGKENGAKPDASFVLDLEAAVLSTGDVYFFANSTSAFIVTSATIDGSAKSTLREFYIGEGSAAPLPLLGSTEIDWDFSLVYDPFRDTFWQANLEKKVIVLRSSLVSHNRTVPSMRIASRVFPESASLEGETTDTELSLQFARVLNRLAVSYLTRESQEVFDFVPLCIDLVPSSLRELSQEIQKEATSSERSLASLAWLTALLHMLLASVAKLNRLTACWIGAVPGFSALQPHEKWALCQALFALLSTENDGNFAELLEHLADVVVDIFSLGYSFICDDSSSQLKMLQDLLTSSSISFRRKSAVAVGALEQLAASAESPSKLFYTSISLQQSTEGAVPTSEFSLHVKNVKTFLALLRLDCSSHPAVKRALLGYLQTCQRDMLARISSYSSDTDSGVDLRDTFLDFSILILRACNEELCRYCARADCEESRDRGPSLEDLYSGLVGQSMPLLLASLIHFDGSVRSRDLLEPLKEATKSLRQTVLATFSSDEIHLVGDKQWSRSPLCEVELDTDVLFYAHDSYGKKKKKKKAKDGELNHMVDLGSGKYERVLSFAPALPGRDRLRRRQAMGFKQEHAIPWLLELETVMATTAGLVGHRIASATSRPDSGDNSPDIRIWNEIQMHKYFRVPKDLTKHCASVSEFGEFWQDFVEEKEGSSARLLLDWIRETEASSQHSEVTAVNETANRFLMLLFHCYGLDKDVVKLSSALQDHCTAIEPGQQSGPMSVSDAEEAVPSAALILLLWQFDASIRLCVSKAAMQILLSGNISSSDRLARVAESLRPRVDLLLYMYKCSPRSTALSMEASKKAGVLRRSGSAQIQQVLRRSRRSDTSGSGGDYIGSFNDGLAHKVIRFVEHRSIDLERLVGFFKEQQELAACQATGLQFLRELIDEFQSREVVVHELLCQGEPVSKASVFTEGIKIYNYSREVASTIRDHSKYILSRICAFIMEREHCDDIRERAFRAAVKFSFLDHQSILESKLLATMLQFLEKECGRIDLTEHWLIFNAVALRCMASEQGQDTKELKEALIDMLCRSIQAYEASEQHIIQVMSILYSCIGMEKVREIVGRSYTLFAKFVVDNCHSIPARELCVRICRRVLPEVFPDDVLPSLMLALLEVIGEQQLSAKCGHSAVLANETVAMMRLLLECDIWDIFVTDALNVALDALPLLISAWTEKVASGAVVDKVADKELRTLQRAMGAFCVLGGLHETFYVGASVVATVAHKSRHGIVVEYDPLSPTMAILFFDGSAPEVINIEAVKPMQEVRFVADKYRLEPSTLAAFVCFFSAPVTPKNAKERMLSEKTMPVWYHQLKCSAVRSLCELLGSPASRALLIHEANDLLMAMFYESMRKIPCAPEMRYDQLFGMLTTLPEGLFGEASDYRVPSEVLYSPCQLLDQLPTRLDQESALHAIIQYKGLSYTWADEPCPACEKKQSAVRANFPIPKQSPFFYFEAAPSESSDSSFVGFICDTGNKSRATLPGISNGSFALHSSGKVFRDGIASENTVTDMEKWDFEAVLGCGWDSSTGTVFFTRNGKLFNIAYGGVFESLYPAVGSTDGKGLEVNFGSKPFKFDWQKYVRASSTVPSEHHPPKAVSLKSEAEAARAARKAAKEKAKALAAQEAAKQKEEEPPRTINGVPVDNARFAMAEQMSNLGFAVRLCYVALQLNEDDMEMASNWMLDSGTGYIEDHPEVDWDIGLDEVEQAEEPEDFAVKLDDIAKEKDVKDEEQEVSPQGDDVAKVARLLAIGNSNVAAVVAQLHLDRLLTLEEDELAAAVGTLKETDPFVGTTVRKPTRLDEAASKHSMSTEKEASSRSSKDEVHVGDLVCCTVKDQTKISRWLPFSYGVVLAIGEERASVGFVQSVLSNLDRASQQLGPAIVKRSILYEHLRLATGTLGEWVHDIVGGRAVALSEFKIALASLARHYLRRIFFVLLTHLKTSNDLLQSIFCTPQNLQRLFASAADLEHQWLLTCADVEGSTRPRIHPAVKPLLNKVTYILKLSSGSNHTVEDPRGVLCTPRSASAAKQKIGQALATLLSLMLHRAAKTYVPSTFFEAECTKKDLQNFAQAAASDGMTGRFAAVGKTRKASIGTGIEPALLQLNRIILLEGMALSFYRDSSCTELIVRIAENVHGADFALERSTVFFRFERLVVAECPQAGDDQTPSVAFRLTELVRKAAHLELSWWLLESIVTHSPALLAAVTPSGSPAVGNGDAVIMEIWRDLSRGALHTDGPERLRYIHMLMKIMCNFQHYRKSGVDLAAFESKLLFEFELRAGSLSKTSLHVLSTRAQLLMELLVRVFLTRTEFQPEDTAVHSLLASSSAYAIVQQFVAVASFSRPRLAAELVLEEDLKVVVKVPVTSTEPFEAKVRPVVPSDFSVRMESDNLFFHDPYPRWSHVSVTGQWTNGESLLAARQVVVKRSNVFPVQPVEKLLSDHAFQGAAKKALTEGRAMDTLLGQVVNNIDVSYRTVDAGSSGLVHEDCYCCGCGSSDFAGCRYVCLSCETLDTEFCSQCLPVDTSQAHDENHLLICLRYPGNREVGEWLELGVLPNTGSNTHIGIQCDECGCNPITGNRYMCAHCEDYDLCASCWEEELSSGGVHYLHHAFIRVTSALTNDSIRGFPIPCLYPAVHEFGVSLVLTPKFTDVAWREVVAAHASLINDRLAVLACAWDTKLDKLLTRWLCRVLDAKAQEVTLETLDPVQLLQEEQEEAFLPLTAVEPTALWFRFLQIKALNTRVPRLLVRTNLPFAWSLGRQLQRVGHLIFPNTKKYAWEAVLQCMGDLYKDRFPAQQPLLYIKRGKAKTPSGAEERVQEKHTLFYQAFSQLIDVQFSSVYGHLRGDDRAWSVKYVGEGSTDEGGPYRELISLMCAELHSENSPLPLFVPCSNAVSESGSNRDAFLPAASCTSTERIMQYFFVGQLIGLAMRTDINLDLNFPSLVWKKLLRQPVTRKDLEQIDVLATNLFKSFEVPAQYGLDESNFEHLFGMAYEVISNDGKKVNLLGTGREQPITWENRLQWVKHAEKYKLNECNMQIDAMRKGIATVVPYDFFYLLDWKDVELASCGTHEFDIELLKRNTVYYEYSESSSAVKYMWQVLESFSPKNQQVFLKFVSGLSRLPTTEVFSRKFAVQQLKTSEPDKYLPKAHTCFFMIDLPNYSTFEVAKKKINDAITLCDTIDMDFNEAVFDPDYNESDRDNGQEPDEEEDEEVEEFSDFEADYVD